MNIISKLKIKLYDWIILILRRYPQARILSYISYGITFSTLWLYSHLCPVYMWRTRGLVQSRKFKILNIFDLNYDDFSLVLQFLPLPRIKLSIMIFLHWFYKIFCYRRIVVILKIYLIFVFTISIHADGDVCYIL